MKKIIALAAIALFGWFMANALKTVQPPFREAAGLILAVAILLLCLSILTEKEHS